MSTWEFMSYGVLALLFIYVAARLCAAAYFKSKQDHESQQRKHHEQRT